MARRFFSLSSTIDQKGKIFGLIHVFDALLILLGILFLLVILKQVFQQKTWVVAEIKITPEQWWFDNYPPPRWLVFSVQKGDREVDWKGATTAEVIDIKNYDTGYDRTISYLKIKFLARHDKKTGKYFYNNKNLSVGSTVELNLSTTTIKGLIVDVDGLTDKREKITKIVTLKLYDKYPWFADAITVGDAMKINGVPIVEIVEKNVQNAEKTNIKVDPGSKLSLTYIDPLKRDITLTTKMRLTKNSDGSLIFRDDQRIIIGNDLFIALPRVNLQYATVIGTD